MFRESVFVKMRSVVIYKKLRPFDLRYFCDRGNRRWIL